MSIANYTDLVSAVGDWLKDTTLTARIPDFIALAEARLNRSLTTSEAEVSKTTSVANSITLPDDFSQIVAIWLQSSPVDWLEPVSLQELRTRYPSNQSGTPVCFALNAGDIILGPPPSDTGDLIVMTYYAQLTPITASSPTNWLLTTHPDAYLFGTLLQAEFYGWNDERLPTIKAAWDSIIDEINGLSSRKRYSGPIRMRAETVA